ncbi:c-type cytochrome biogenesis protein CcsB [Piscinibacterium candidicorallinum]|uniref:C-type cytochrome biogenesis protein CcsB n=1 Tax=Piscinibacterium candidicorallinum TaxID=1793872 RepID=A0ABV7H132_9BURK
MNTTTVASQATQTPQATGQSVIISPRSGIAAYFSRSAFDWGFAALIFALMGYTLWRYDAKMDSYETWILIGTAPGLIALGWAWRPLAYYFIGSGALALLAIAIYGGDLKQAEQAFLLKYFLSSQSAILWMCLLYMLACVCYWIGLFAHKETPQWMGTVFTWAASVMGTIGMLVRWREGHLIGPDIGHIPVSNLYEVFVLFAVMTSIFYLYYEAKHKTRAMGAFVSLVVVAAVAFLLWYTFDRQAHEIQPLVPALQSWWMKLHVPANFVGYGTFSIAAMVGFAYLLKDAAATNNKFTLGFLFVMGVALCIEPLVFRTQGLPTYWALYFGISALFAGSVVIFRKRIAAVLPSFEVMDDVMYKAIAIGFAFFTIATILGALWAAEAWGAYWQWDPKETWALIVWLNYAAWLHLRFIKGLRGTFAAYWAVIGLLITGFAFLGVNMFLSGLHSYGAL